MFFEWFLWQLWADPTDIEKDPNETTLFIFMEIFFKQQEKFKTEYQTP